MPRTKATSTVLDDDGSKEKKDTKAATKPIKEVKEEVDDLYCLHPSLCAKDIIINVEANPKIIHRPGHPTRRLLKGDRVQGKFYKELAEPHKIMGVSLCYKLTEKHLKDLETDRREREGLIMPDWIKEAHALRDK